ncbi:MAG: class I SAM-dependent methyltransferase [candidate division Zixibacteria bacterium]|nr:class I SAM-dependent methyltransferase [candidate division Zixibacteria bacterium]
MEDYISHYNKDGKYFDYNRVLSKGRRQVEHRRREAIMYFLKSLKENSLILDLGSGSGSLTKLLSEKRFHVIPADLSIDNLKAISSPNCYPVYADGYQLPFQDNCFDAVILSSVLEHCKEPIDMLKESKRVLSSNGIIISVTPFNENILYHQCVHCNKLTPSYAHLHSFNENKLTSLFERCKLDILRVYKFANITLDVTRSNLLLKYFSFPIWMIIDSIVNRIIPRQEFILIAARK